MITLAKSVRKLPRDHLAARENYHLQRKEKINETRNQCAGQRTGSSQPTRRRTRTVSLPEQRAKLPDGSEGWSLDRLRTDASRQGHPGTGDSERRTGALVRHQD